MGKAVGGTPTGTPFDGVCLAIDQSPALEGAAVSYVSSDGAIPIRGSDRVMENHVVVTPAGEGSPRPEELKRGLIDVGVNCGLAGVSYAFTAAACAGGVVTMGTSAPLCIIGAAGLSASTWKCTTSIGKLVNTIQDPKINTMIERDDSLYRWLDDKFWYVDQVSSVLSALTGAAQLGSLLKVSREHGFNLSQTFSRKKSIQAYKEMMDVVGEAFTAKKVLEGVNTMGWRQWFGLPGIPGNVRSALANGMDPRHIRQMVRDGRLRPHFSGRGTLMGIAKETTAGVAGSYDDEIADGLKTTIPKGPAWAPAPRTESQGHVIHVLQQANPGR